MSEMDRTLRFKGTSLTVLLFLGTLAWAGKEDTGLVGLPPVKTLKDKLQLTEAQTKKIAVIYEDFRDRAKEAEEKGDENKKAELRREIIVQIKGVCTSDQRQQLDEIIVGMNRP
jgi:hypothetical protein